MVRMVHVLGISGMLIGIAAPARADKWSSRGELTAEGRAFLPATDDANDYNTSLAGRLEITYKKKPFKAHVRLFGRVDAQDSGRSAYFAEEAWLRYKKKKLRIIAGYQLQNWSKTEVFHPTDVINSRYLDGDIQYPEKIGELMLSARLKFGDGNIELFYMPRFREAIFPSAQSRYRLTPPGIALADSYIQDRNGNLGDDQWHAQWAARLNYRFGDLEVAAHGLQHIDRNPQGVIIDAQGPHLVYAPVTQVGGTFTYVLGGLLLKGEGSFRMLDEVDFGPFGVGVTDRQHGFAVLGAEYGVSHDSGAQSTFLAEGQALLGAADDALPFVLFTHHAMVGWRYEFGDMASTTLLGTAIVDVLEPDHVIFGGEISRRLGGTFKLTIGTRFVHLPADNPSAKSGYEFLSGANQVYGKLARYF